MTGVEQTYSSSLHRLAQYNTKNNTTNTKNNTMAPQSASKRTCTFRRLLCTAIVMGMLGVTGGVLLWHFLPDEQKDTVNTLIDNGIPFQTGDAPSSDYQFQQCTDPTRCCNGLTSNCDMDVQTVLFAGLHNGQSSAQDNFFLAPNHQFSMRSALDYGYRVLNMDLGVCQDGALTLVHGLCKLGTSDPVQEFTAIQEWLDANPTEIVLIPIQINNDAGGGTVDLGRLYNLLNRIDGFTDRMYQKVVGQSWPTMGDLVDSDKRILFFHYNGDSCSDENVDCPPGFHDWFSYAAETPFEIKSLEEFDDKETVCAVTRGRPRAPFYALNLFLTLPSREAASSKLNTKAFLMDHIQACSALNFDMDVNVLFVDFWDEGALPEVVQTHNKNLAVQRRGRFLRFW